MDKQKAEKRANELRQKIERANRAYYDEANPIISDKQYDEYLDELKELEESYKLDTDGSPTQRIGEKPTDEFPTVQHPVAMLSLDNTYNEAELNDFDERVRKNIPREEYNYLAELKFDGAALRLRYENGKLTLGATRGDGNQGDDITNNVRTIDDIPLSLTNCGHDVIEIRGEAYMERQAFVRLNEYREKEGRSVYANPRNLTAGSLKMLDPAMVAKRPLRFFCFDLILSSID